MRRCGCCFEDFNIFLGRDWLLTVSEGAAIPNS
jgi:hypothetical protein